LLWESANLGQSGGLNADMTVNKNYSQLAQAFKMTCIQRFGVETDRFSAGTGTLSGLELA
jgi:hypothetical protein